MFIEGEWDGLLAGLEVGRYDMMANGVDITTERQGKYDFSIPYAYNRTAVIVREDDERIHTLEDLAGMTTANTISSTYAQLAEQYGATVTAVDDLNQTMELLLAGRIDATLNSEVTFYDYLRARPDAKVRLAVLTEEATEVAIPLHKGESTATLRAAIDQALEELRADGTLTALSEKYFGSDITQPYKISGPFRGRFARLQEFFNLRLGAVANGPGHGLAVFEHHQGGNAGHAELHGKLHLLVHIDLAYSHVGALPGDFLHNGAHHPAGAAPACPEVQQDRLLRLGKRFEILFGNGCNGHTLSLLRMVLRK